jgi:hypothetical protein
MGKKNYSNGMAELAYVSILHHKDPVSNLAVDRKFFLIQLCHI